jgi:KTSC domain
MMPGPDTLHTRRFHTAGPPVSYDPNQSTLDLTFCNGAIYRYFDVPANVHNELITANLKGTYFNRHIRSCFTCQRLTMALDRLVRIRDE